MKEYRLSQTACPDHPTTSGRLSCLRRGYISLLSLLFPIIRTRSATPTEPSSSITPRPDPFPPGFLMMSLWPKRRVAIIALLSPCPLPLTLYGCTRSSANLYDKLHAQPQHKVLESSPCVHHVRVRSGVWGVGGVHERFSYFGTQELIPNRIYFSKWWKSYLVLTDTRRKLTSQGESQGTVWKIL